MKYNTVHLFEVMGNNRKLQLAQSEWLQRVQMNSILTQNHKSIYNKPLSDILLTVL